MARVRAAGEYRVGASWRTLEDKPRYLKILGVAAIDEEMMVAELELQDRRVWIRKGTGVVYDQGRMIARAECVEQGRPEYDF